jgi:hypothetical protein
VPAGVPAGPAPTPNLALTSAGSVPSAVTPAHSPYQIIFGSVWQGDIAKQTVHFQSLASGYIRVDVPSPFRVAEIRALGSGGSSKNSGKGTSQVPLGPQVKTRVSFTPNQPGPYTALIDASTDVDIDVVFQPQAQASPGDKSAIMKITGPGPIHDWGFSVPLHGTVQTGLVAQPSQVWANDGDTGASINVLIPAIGTPVSGILKGGEVLPPGVSITPQSLTTGAGEGAQVHLWLNFNGIPADGKFRPLQLVFEAPNHSTSTQIQLAAVSGNKLQVNSGNRGDCGVSSVSLSLDIDPPHQAFNFSGTAKFSWVMKGRNLDLFNNRTVWMRAESGGITILTYSLQFPFSNANEVRDQSKYMVPLYVSPEEWARIVKGPFRFGCAQTKDTWLGDNPPDGTKWAPAVKGLNF